MFEPTEREVDRGVQESMEMFEKAQVGEVSAIEPQRPQRVLLALDGSSQDELSVSMAAALRRRFACSLHVMDAREDFASNQWAEEIAQRIEADVLAKASGDSYEQILEACQDQGCDLVIVPCPFGRNLEKVGSDSTGTVIDVLLARSPAPLLVTRHVYALEDEPFAHVLMVLIGENEAAPSAAAWAVGMVATGGALELMLILEREAYENFRQWMVALDSKADVDPDQLAKALQRSQLRLHRSLQKSAKELGFEERFSIRQESKTPLEELAGGQQHPLLVLALERSDHRSQGHVHDRIRHSPHAVLVVPFG